MTLRPAVFFDRDNTLVFDPGYLSNPDLVRFLPGVVESLRRLQAAGYVLVVVSNQSGVARGYFGLDDVESVNRRIAELLEREGIRLEGFYVCPHGSEEGCSCRKPNPGLLLKAAEELNLDLSKSFMVGDKVSDVESGRRAGLRSFLVAWGPESKEGAESLSENEIVPDVASAVEKILATFPGSSGVQSA